MRDEPPDLPVHDVSLSPDSTLVPDPVDGRSPRVSGLLVLGVAGIATVASIVLAANHSDAHRSAAPAVPPTKTALPPPPAPVTVSIVPPAPTAALVEGETTCFSNGPGRGGAVSLGIRNRLSHAVVVQRVSFAAQRGVGTATTSIGIDRRSPSACPTARNLHPAAHYRLAPGPVWISVRLTRTPACGTELRSAWLVSFTDRGKVRRMSFAGAGFTTNCPPRAHVPQGR